MRSTIAAVFAIFVVAIIAVRPADAGKADFCCQCFCRSASTSSDGGGAGIRADVCFTLPNDSEADKIRCAADCGAIECLPMILDAPCTLENCAVINPGATSPAPALAPVGAMLAALAAALAGGWSLLRRRRA